MGTSGALAAKQMSFEFLRKCLGGQRWSPPIDGEAVPCGRIWYDSQDQTGSSVQFK